MPHQTLGDITVGSVAPDKKLEWLSLVGISMEHGDSAFLDDPVGPKYGLVPVAGLIKRWDDPVWSIQIVELTGARLPCCQPKRQTI